MIRLGIKLRDFRLKLPEGLSNSCIKKINGCSYKDRFGNKIDTYPVFLLGQLAKNENYPKFKGKEILTRAINLIYAAREIVGGNVILIDYRPIEKLEKFYIDNGFKKIDNCIGRGKEYKQMIRILK